MSLLVIALMAITASIIVKKIKANPLRSVGIIIAIFFILTHLRFPDSSQIIDVSFKAGLVILLVISVVAIWRFRKHKATWNREFPTPPASPKRRVDL